MTQHSRDDALSERQFEELLEGARQLDEPWDFEARLVILLAGKLGMRGGEIAHLSAEWIDENRRMIDIPERDTCKKGKNGGPCGYCRERAREHLDSHNYTQEEAEELVREEMGDVEIGDDAVAQLAEEKMDKHNKSLGQALEKRWEPKTKNGARSIPYDIDMRVQMVVEEFLENYDIFPKARVAVNRRVTEATEAAGIEERVYPHALRATAATEMALHDVSSYSLMGILGWADIETARSYIQASDENAAKEVRAKHR